MVEGIVSHSGDQNQGIFPAEVGAAIGAFRGFVKLRQGFIAELLENLGIEFRLAGGGAKADLFVFFSSFGQEV